MSQGSTPAQPPHEAFCNTTGLSYLHAGASGRAALLVHGIGASKEIWWSTIGALAHDSRVFAPDLPAHGRSPASQTYGMPQIAAALAAFCAAHEMREIALVGHSMGGNIALELTLSHPQLVRTLVLVDPAVRADAIPLQVLSARLGRAQRWAILRAGIAMGQRVGYAGRLVPRERRGGLILSGLRRASYWARHDVGGVFRQLDQLIGNPLAARLAEIRVPTLVISGQFDTLVPPEHSRRAAQAIPGARYAMVRGASHNPMDEQPDHFEQILLDFLRNEQA